VLHALTGTLPEALSNLKNLAFLDVSMNKLQGPLPDAFKSLEALGYAGFGLNLFTGSIPSSWLNMRSLVFAVFAGNPELTGCLPKSWETQFHPEVIGVAKDQAQMLMLAKTNITGFCST
jgi:hypothetical protein